MMQFSGRAQREAPRVPMKGVLALYESDLSVDRYRVVNLSKSGTLLASGQHYPIGTALDLFIVTPDLAVIEVSGKVVRHDPPLDSIGIKFSTFSLDAEHALENLIQQMS